MSATAVPASSLSRSHRLMFPVGLVLAGVMGAFNLMNGVGTLIDPAFGQTDPTLAPNRSSSVSASRSLVPSPWWRSFRHGGGCGGPSWP
jgi:hypothetical protein